ncbi:MAG: cell envelope integrity EipB family protein [Rhizobiales bacterium]|nr:cell envelope integrity EipB family protein [Hyphomicrobiales bacterium]
MTKRVNLLVFLALSGAAAAGPAAAESVEAGGIALAPHRAVYDLQLAGTTGKQSLEAVRGRILYDFSGSACEGYTLQFRQVTQLDSGEGKSVTSDLRTTNWEEGHGKAFRFATRNFLNNEPADSSEGKAERQGADAAVTLTKPDDKTLTVKDVVFPSDQMRQVIAAAKQGRPILELGVYDGSDNGEKIYNTLSVIGHAIKAGDIPSGDAAAKEKGLEKLTRWPVTVSYFDRAKAGGDQTPVYSIAFEIYENGIARALKLDYGDFKLSGELTTLEMKEAKPCP